MISCDLGSAFDKSLAKVCLERRVWPSGRCSYLASLRGEWRLDSPSCRSVLSSQEWRIFGRVKSSRLWTGDYEVRLYRGVLPFRWEAYGEMEISSFYDTSAAADVNSSYSPLPPNMRWIADLAYNMLTNRDALEFVEVTVSGPLESILPGEPAP